MGITIVYSSDDNYAQHVGVSMLSLFEKNKELDEIVIYILANHISMENKCNLSMIAARYGRSIIFYEIAILLEKLPLNIGNSIAISSYARLFLSSVIPEDIDKILYLYSD